MDEMISIQTVDREMTDEGNPATRVLVVDDDPLMNQMIVDYLREHGMPALSASGGEEMARHLATGEPSLVILDLRLGQEDGLDSCARSAPIPTCR